MSEGGFLEQKPRSPTSLVIVIALHAAAITALALAKMDVPVMKIFTPLKIKPVEVQPEPPPAEKIEPKEAPTPRSEITRRDPLVDIPAVPTFKLPAVPTLDPPVLTELVVPEPKQTPRAEPAPPPAEPVRVEAKIDSRSQLQPPYPPAEQRRGVEGSVTIRVFIDANGRVTRVERVNAANDAFYRATERQALRNWRFKPATLDGKPVETSKIMTVHFRIEQ